MTQTQLPLSQELHQIAQRTKNETISLRELLLVIRGKSYIILLILCSIPFLTPLPLLGLSVPFGVVVALVGIRLCFGMPPWLPERILDTKLSSNFIPKVLEATSKLIKWIEYLIRPRLTQLITWRVFSPVYGLIICINGILLSLPLPVPFSNGFPAWSTLLLSCGMLERDGLFVLAGLFVFIASACFFALIFIGGGALVHQLFAHFQAVT
jgi:hypothetical protein